MKKIILATIGLAMFATPAAADNVHSSGYSVGERHIYGGIDLSPPDLGRAAAPERFAVSPFGAPQSFALAPPRNAAGPSYSSRGALPNQDLREQYGRIDR